MTDGLPADFSVPGDAIDSLCLRNLLASSNELIYFKDTESRFLRVSHAQADRLAAGDVEAVLGLTDSDFHDEAHATKSRADEVAIMQTGSPMIEAIEKATYPNAQVRYVETSKQPLRNGAGAIIGTFGLSRDVTERVMLDAELTRANGELRRLAFEMSTLLESSPDPIARFDRQLRCVYANAAVEQLIGHAVLQLIGDAEKQMRPVLPEPMARMMEQVFECGENAEFEHSVAAGTQTRHFHTLLVPERDATGEVASILAVSRDFTERKRAEDALAEQAVHDPLTGLANRVLLLDRVAQALARLERQAGVVAVLFVDLDGFKQVNDAHGHIAGDALLAEVARRLRGCARREDTVARFGGDEFVVLCERFSDRATAVRLAQRITAAVAEPFLHIDAPLLVTASVGIALCAAPQTTPEQLLQAADRAMYVAKGLSAHRGGHSVSELLAG